MPKLGEYQYLLDTVFFLYPDEESARKGKRSGGTGFFVAVPSETFPQQYHHIYAVTNWHVAVNGNPVIRVNRKLGHPEIFPFESHEWTFIPMNHDIAVIRVELNAIEVKAEAINATSFFLSDADIAEQEINAGEDVFMLGRFVDYDGIEANCPSMRFGNISMMEAKVKQPNGYVGRSIVVDMHSRTGYSGSPVFVWRTAGSIFANRGSIIVSGHLMKLLGILWGQFPEDWDIKDKAPPIINLNADLLSVDGAKVKGWSGMSLVIPASAIWEVLNEPRLRADRTTIDNQLHEQHADAPRGV